MAGGAERPLAGAVPVGVRADNRLRAYLSLTKPGVLLGNVITGVAGFLLGASYFHSFDIVLFVATIAGMTLVIASACVLNNVLDADIDAVMERTRARAVAHGDIAPWPATALSAVLGIAGIAILALRSNWLVVGIGVAGFVVYVWLYGALSKRRSVHGTLVGSVSGAAPVLAGYVAVAGRFDAAALLLFLALFFWQFPEFYSIAIYRRKEYAAAGIPVMTVKKGVRLVKVQILIYAVLFVAASLMLTILGYTGWVYFTVMALAGGWWIWLGAQGFRAKSADAWARQMFHASLNILLLFSLMLAVGALLP